MPSVSRTFTVTAPPSAVVPYLADFSNAEEWDPGTVSCTREGSGPVEVGATWHNESKIAGISTELTYTLEELTDSHIVLVGRNETATSTETIDVLPADGGSEITYENEIEFKGAAKLAAPAAKVIFEKVANDTVKQMTEVLNSLHA